MNTNLEEISHFQTGKAAPLLVMVAPPNVLITGYEMSAEIWPFIERMEVIMASQIQILNCSREAVEMLNVVKKQREHSIYLLENWRGFTLGHLHSLMHMPVQLRLQFKTEATDRPFHYNLEAYKQPQSYDQLIKAGIRLDCMILTREISIMGSEPLYRFPVHGTILRVLIKSVGEQEPQLTYGNHWIHDTEPTRISPEWWYMDLRQSPLDTTQTANICLQLGQRDEQYAQIVVEQFVYHQIR